MGVSWTCWLHELYDEFFVIFLWLSVLVFMQPRTQKDITCFKFCSLPSDAMSLTSQYNYRSAIILFSISVEMLLLGLCLVFMHNMGLVLTLFCFSNVNAKSDGIFSQASPTLSSGAAVFSLPGTTVFLGWFGLLPVLFDPVYKWLWIFWLWIIIHKIIVVA